MPPVFAWKHLCTWIGVEDSTTLYEMTAQGKKWWGDPSSPSYDDKTAMQPFGGAPGSPSGGIFGERDRRVLETLFYPFAVRFGYRAPEQFMRGGSYQLLRAGIEDRRRVLDELGDYPGMLTPLEIPPQ